MKRGYLAIWGTAAVLTAAIFLETNALAEISQKMKTETGAQAEYVSISGEEAFEIINSEEDYVILDVRSAEEYEEGHVPGAVLLPLDEIEERYFETLPDQDQLVLVYCRSGRRSKIASEFLADKGYIMVREFGGILDWEYETEAGPYEPAAESLMEEESETETCKHEWIEDCISKTCSKCGEYHRITQ